MGYKRKKLVALIYAPDPRYVRVVKLDDAVFQEEKIEVNVRMGTWSCPKNACSTAQIKRVGESTPKEQGRRIIGVYDSSNITDLGSMVHAAREAINTRTGHENN